MRLHRLGIFSILWWSYACSEPSRSDSASAGDDEEQFSEQDVFDIALTAQHDLDTNIPTLDVYNVTSGGDLNSGFLVGRCLDDRGVQNVQVSLDDSNYIDAEGGVEWRFELPQNSHSWRPGSVHRINIRCLDTSGNSSIPNHFLVRQGPKRDINGDGFADLIFGAPNAPLPGWPEDGRRQDAAGRLYIINGRHKGFASSGPTSDRADSILLGDGAFHHFSAEIAVGDFNADGFADIAASEPDFDGGKGRISIILGQKFLPVEGRLKDHAAQFINGHSTTGSLGKSISVFDINNDGFDDLIIGQSSSPGRVFALHGSVAGIASGLTSLGTGNATTTLIGTTAAFGSKLANCDINQDSFPDLIVGEPKQDGGGRILIYPGSSEGLKSASKYIITAASRPETFANEFVCADFNGDLLNDLAISLSPSATGDSDRKGKVVVISGEIWATAGEVDLNATIARRHAVVLTGRVSSGFGDTLGTADFERDGTSDLIIGAPLYDQERGRTYLFNGGHDFFRIKRTTRQRTTAFFSGSEIRESLGSAIAAGIDFNIDGQPDLILASPNYGGNSHQRLGRIYIIYSPAGGFSADAQAGAIADSMIIGDAAGIAIGQKIP